MTGAEFQRKLDERLGKLYSDAHEKLSQEITEEVREIMRKTSLFAWTDKALDDCMHLICHDMWDKG